MSAYKEYRPKARITARVVERTIKVPQANGNYLSVNAGDYEVLAEDGTVSYHSKAEFEAANEPVRRERQAKATSKSKGGSKNRVEKEKAAPAQTSAS